MSWITMYPANILKTPCEPLVLGSKQARDVADALQMALRLNKRKVIGLAAPQIGQAVRAFALDTKHLRLTCPSVFVNPDITWSSDETDVMAEGCLSFPDSVLVPVRRPTRCTVKAFNANGAEFTVSLSGMAARCALHEVDHLDAITVIDYATPAMKKKVMKAIAKALQLKVVKSHATIR